MLGLRSYLLLTVALAAGPANAAIVTYSNTMAGADFSGTYTGIRSLWQGELSSLATVTFDDVPTGFFNNTTLVYDTSNSTFSNQPFLTALTQSQIQIFRFASGSRSRAVWGGSNPIPSSSNRYFEGFAGPSNTDYVQVTLPTPATASITAIALDLWTQSSSGQNVNVAVYDAANTLIQTYIVPTNPNSTAAFFGITSDAALGYLRISSTGGGPMLAQVDFGVLSSGDPGPGPSADTPESATLGYVGIGVLAIYLGTNRKARQQS
ncbi:MAG: hypothetical protein JNL98_26100 [Bryobacterales bacterium]|nr:hypothetical protein [Bryobacterales bacterium]